MAKPRIFISSTYYDLKHIRSSIEGFIESLGYDVILSEKGSIAYNPDIPLDESCYREAKGSDIFVLIIGGRYGSPQSTEKSGKKKFYDRYESVTKMEFESALENEIPVYILIDKSVKAEYETFKNNRDNDTVKYAHVDSINIFHLIERILNLRKNNPVKEFENHNDIESWLKNQWAGLFQELIKKRKDQAEISELSSQVSELASLNQTLKSYLEEIVTSTSEDKGVDLIKREQEKLEERRKIQKFKEHNLSQFLIDGEDIQNLEQAIEFISEPKTFKDLAKNLAETRGENDGGKRLLNHWKKQKNVMNELNELREILGLPDFK
jgi:hypothetical protein